VVEKQLRNNDLPVPLRRDDTVGFPGAKKGFPVVGKSLFAVGYSVLLCGRRGGLCFFPFPNVQISPLHPLQNPLRMRIPYLHATAKNPGSSRHL